MINCVQYPKEFHILKITVLLGLFNIMRSQGSIGLSTDSNTNSMGVYPFGRVGTK